MAINSLVPAFKDVWYHLFEYSFIGHHFSRQTVNNPALDRGLQKVFVTMYPVSCIVHAGWGVYRAIMDSLNQQDYPAQNQYNHDDSCDTEF